MSSTQSADSSRDIHSTLYLETANYHSNFSDYCNRWINEWYPKEKTVQIRTSEIGIVLLIWTFNPAKNQAVVLFQHSSYLWIGYFYGLLGRHGSLQGSIFFSYTHFPPAVVWVAFCGVVCVFMIYSNNPKLACGCGMFLFHCHIAFSRSDGSYEERFVIYCFY